MGAEAPVDSPDVREAAAAAVAPDALTADLLAKHSAGEKLSPSEYGKLGAWKARLKAVFGGKSDAPGGPGNGKPASGQPARMGAVGATEAPADGLAPVSVDPGLVERTTAAILNRCDAFTRRWIESEARKAGATGTTLDRFRSAAGLPPADRQLIVDLSPDIWTELGIDPRQFPLWIAGAVLIAHAGTLWLTVDELRGMQAERRVERVRDQAGRPEGSAHVVPMREASAPAPIKT